MIRRLSSSKRTFWSALTLSVTMLVLIAGLVFAASVSIDNFNVGVTNLTASSDDPVQSQIRTSTSALGGDREVTLDWVAGTGADVTMRINYLTSQRMSFNAGDGITARSIVRWDGLGGTAEVNDQLLGGVDLTGGATNDGLDIQVINDDLPAKLIVRVYSDATNYSTYTINTLGGINSPALVDYFIKFDDFSDSGTGANFASVSSIEIEIDGTIEPGTDISIDMLDANNFREYGDLPADFGASVTGASHLASGLRLGKNMDIEAVASPDANAGTSTTGDDATNVAGKVDDEDGVVGTNGFKWSDVAGGSLDVTVNGCPTASTCYVNGWIDWNKNNAFDAGEQVVDDHAFTSAQNGFAQSLTFSIPAGTDTTTNSFYGRFRVCAAADACDVPDNSKTEVAGEIEDYLFSSSPTSVAMTDLKAGAASLPFVGAAAALVIALAAAFVLRRR